MNCSACSTAQRGCCFQGRARGAIVFEDSRPHPTSAALVAQPFRTAKFGGPGRPEGLRDVPYSRT